MSRRPSHRDVQPVTDLVTDEECYAAMQWMDEIAHEYGRAYALVDLRIALQRSVEAAGMLASDEKSSDRRQAEARSSDDYREASLMLFAAQQRYKELDLKRQVAVMRCEIWRTIHADKRAREVPEPGRR